jgi:hypothetical protein
MKNEDLLKCPLLQGLDAMHRAELLGLINDSSLREKLEGCMGRLACSNEECKEPAVQETKPTLTQHEPQWNPESKLWPSGAKE